MSWQRVTILDNNGLIKTVTYTCTKEPLIDTCITIYRDREQSTSGYPIAVLVEFNFVSSLREHVDNFPDKSNRGLYKSYQMRSGIEQFKLTGSHYGPEVSSNLKLFMDGKIPFTNSICPLGKSIADEINDLTGGSYTKFKRRYEFFRELQVSSDSFVKLIPSDVTTIITSYEYDSPHNTKDEVVGMISKFQSLN